MTKFKAGDRVVRKQVQEDGARIDVTMATTVPDGTRGIIREVAHLASGGRNRYFVELENGFNRNWWYEENCQLEIDEKQLAKDVAEARKEMASWFTPH